MKTSLNTCRTLLAPAFLLACSASCKAALLSTLLGGGSLAEGNATYSNFALNNANPSPPASSINVTASTAASGASVITFTVVGGGWTIPADSSIITFDASFATPISAVGLDFIAAGTATGIASVGETTTYTFNALPVSNNLQVATDGFGPLLDSLSDFEPLAHNTTSLSIIKSIDIASSGGSASITSVSNSFFPIPEPASLALLALGVLLSRRPRA